MEVGVVQVVRIDQELIQIDNVRLRRDGTRTLPCDYGCGDPFRLGTNWSTSIFAFSNVAKPSDR